MRSGLLIFKTVLHTFIFVLKGFTILMLTVNMRLSEAQKSVAL